MLTKSDLSKIKTIVDQSVETKLEKKLKPIHKKLNKVQKSLNVTVKYFDTVTTNHTKRIKRIENHLDLPLISSFA